jgi:hypothetical protein
VEKMRDILLCMLIAVHNVVGRVNQPRAWTLNGPATRHFPSLFAITPSININTIINTIDSSDGWSGRLRLSAISYYPASFHGRSYTCIHVHDMSGTCISRASSPRMCISLRQWTAAPRTSTPEAGAGPDDPEVQAG